MNYGDAVYAGCWESAGQECAAVETNSNRPDRQAQLQQQVCELRSELDALHAHYTQLLDRLAPRWRQDRTGLEVVTTVAPWSGSSAAPPQRQQQQQHQAIASAAQAAGNAAQSGLQQQPAASASRQQQGTGGFSSSTTNNDSPGDAARSMLEGQLESARRHLRSAERTTARLEEELTAAAEAAAGREMSLNTQLRKAKAAATAAAAAAAEERAALAAQVRTLTSDMSELKSAHAAQLAATQQRLQSLTEQLAAQQLNNLKQQPGQSVASSPTPTDSPSPVLQARTAPQRPKSAAAAATVRPLTTAAAAAAAGPSRAASKPSWVVTGSAALVRQECVKDSLYAGALIDSNAGKDIRLAVDGSSSSGGGAGSSSGWGCRPSTAPGRGAHAGSSEEAALLLRLQQQVERQVTSELQHKAAALLQVYTATPAAATSAVLADALEGSALGADDVTAAAATAAAATAETAPAAAAAAGAAGKSEASAAAVAAGGQSGDELLLAGLAVTLQAEVSRLRQQLQSEQQQNQALLAAVRSVQRTHAAAACSYLAGVTRPDSPPMPLKAAAMGAAHTPAAAGVHSRPASAAAGRVGSVMPWGLQGHQQAPTSSSSSTKTRPSSTCWHPAVVPSGASPAAGVLQGSSSSSSIGWRQAGVQHSSSGPQQDMDLGGSLGHVTVRLTSALSQS